MFGKDFYRMMLFAPDKGTGGEEIDVDIDFEEDDGSIELDVEEENDEIDIGDVNEDDKKPPKEEPKEKLVSKKALDEEREKRKKLSRELAELKNNMQKSGTTEASVDKQKFIDAGFDESISELLASALSNVSGKTSNIEKLVGKKFREQEFKELSKDYPDIDEYREDLDEYADKKGLTLEEAYFAKFGRQKVKNNQADMRRQIEEQVREEYRKKGSMKFDTTDNGESAPKNKSKLSTEELQLAKMAGMTPTEYYIMKSAKSFDGISKAMKKKG